MMAVINTPLTAFKASGRKASRRSNGLMAKQYWVEKDTIKNAM